MKIIKLLAIVFMTLFFLSCEKDVFEADSGTFKDNRDGNKYEYVKIGGQIWMAENLAYLPEVSPPTEISNFEPHYYVYDYDGNSISKAIKLENYEAFGVLYNWSAVVPDNHKNGYDVCPKGWHLPSYDEWSELENHLEDNGLRQVGKALASKTHWIEYSGQNAVGNNMEENNASGFNALPAGILASSGFDLINQAAIFWLTPPNGISNPYAASLGWRDFGFHVGDGLGDAGFSVRCLKN
jgi:uncharacterized protein (TIGR02145 family)